MFTAAMLEERNNRMIFLWEINFILMQIWLIVWLLQHGRREHTVFQNAAEHILLYSISNLSRRGGWADSTLGDFEPELRKQRQRGISFFFFFFLERFLRLTVIGGIMISCKLIMVFYLFQTTSSPLFNDVLFVNRKKSSPLGRRTTVHCVCRLFIVAPLFAF